MKISPSSRYQLRIDSIVSSTARMKQALTCCGLGVPTLNQTGELKLNTRCSSIQVSSCKEHLGVGLGGEAASLDAGPVVDVHHPVDELAQALDLRCAEPTAPRKYLLVTMFVAFTDQKLGTPRRAARS